MPLNILIADDHAVVRYGVSLLIKEIRPAANIFLACDYVSLINVLKKDKVDLVVCDINMPGCNGFHVMTDIRKIQKDIKILVFSAYPETLYAPRYLQAGANGYLHKETESEAIQNAVVSVLETGTYISDAVKESLARKAVQPNERSLENPLEILSDREVEVARLIMQGQGLLEISNALDLHIATVSTYKKRIYEKMNISNLPELIAVCKNYF